MIPTILIQTVGILSGSLSTAAFVPQVYTVVRRKSVEGLSGKTYCIFTLSLIGWITYGILQQDIIMTSFNVGTLFLAGIIDAYFIRELVRTSSSGPSSPPSSSTARTTILPDPSSPTEEEEPQTMEWTTIVP